jgi:hypothetical protein
MTPKHLVTEHPGETCTTSTQCLWVTVEGNFGCKQKLSGAHAAGQGLKVLGHHVRALRVCVHRHSPEERPASHSNVKTCAFLEFVRVLVDMYKAENRELLQGGGGGVTAGGVTFYMKLKL